MAPKNQEPVAPHPLYPGAPPSPFQREGTIKRDELPKSNIGAADLTGNEPVVIVEHVAKSFNGRAVLRDINLTIHRGENIVVLGKSGTGKSVLIKCLVGLLTPDAGRLEVLGQNVPDLDTEQLDKLRIKIGFLFQSAALYDSMSVKDNLEFPLKRHRRELSSGEREDIIDEALREVGLLEAKTRMPSDLSGGMRKRVGLARTLILKPEIMLYDEPTTGLDPITSREISELIVQTQHEHQISSIIITHDIPCARITANRMVVLKDGEYVARGTFDELSQSTDPFVHSFFL